MRNSPIESIHVVERKISDRQVLFPQHDERQTEFGIHSGGDGAFVNVRPCDDVPPIRSLIGARALNKLRSDGLEKSIPSATDAVSMFTPRYVGETSARSGMVVSNAIGKGVSAAARYGINAAVSPVSPVAMLPEAINPRFNQMGLKPWVIFCGDSKNILVALRCALVRSWRATLGKESTVCHFHRSRSYFWRHLLSLTTKAPSWMALTS